MAVLRLPAGDQFLSTVNAIETISEAARAYNPDQHIDKLGSILPTDAPPAAGVMPRQPGGTSPGQCMHILRKACSLAD